MQDHPHFKAYLALAAICFFWGTTYLGIRVGLESFPPLTMVSLRFLLSGAVMLAGSRMIGSHLPRGRELIQTALNGVLILGVGNSCLTVAELWIPSGLAALIITTSPLWMVGIDALLPGGDRLRRPTLLGILVGGVGALILIAPKAMSDAEVTGGRIWAAFLLLQLANFSWCFGSLRQRRLRGEAHPIVNGAIQQLAAGLAFLPVSLLVGGPIRWDLKGVGAVLYLVVFGSILGYSAYAYALDRLPVALVSMYTYVNPIVALSLGWLFYREPFGLTEAAGMAVIFLGVALVKRYSHEPVAVEVD